jgi:tRNA-splicing ligase RtcB (3'-phosphate/5'-hydroxy nucleic acid ligase)
MAMRHAFLAGPLPDDVRVALDRLEAAPDVVHVAVMPDVHLAEDVCVGTVVATRATIYPAAVGGDIGCGMAAIAFDVPADTLADPERAARVLAGLYARVPRDRHRAADMAGDGPEAELSAPALTALARREGRAQLGTLGSGNHFVELQADDAGTLWLMVHSGSRGLGPAIRAPGLVGVPADTDAGRAYLADLGFALAWADANRRHLVDAASAVLADVLGAAPRADTWIACHHNHVRREHVHGETLWIHRKGAIPAADGEPGVIPGSMGTSSYHVVGRGHADALASSSHGAGRAMSRSEARRRVSARTLVRELDGVWFDHRSTDVLRDEAPSAYKDIGQVMRAQHALTRVVRRLRPILAFKGA